MDEIKSFLKGYLAKKGKGTERQAKIILSNWEKFIEQKSAVEVKPRDIDLFIFRKSKDWKPRTLLAYLFHLAQYFGGMQEDKLKERIMERRKEIRDEMKEKSPKIAFHREVLKILKAVTDPRHKLILRLLLWSEIPIGCLEKLQVKDFNIKERKYETRCNDDGKTIHGVLYSDIPIIIEEVMKQNNLRQENYLIGIKTRTIHSLIPKYAKKIGITYRVTPLDLREFAKNPARDMLIEEYERVQKRGFLPQKIEEWEKDEIIRPLIMQLPLVTDENFRQLSPHNQFVYKFGIILDTMGVKKIQLDLTSKIPTPPFKSERKESYTIKDNRYDVKGFHKEQLFIVEVQDKGDLPTTLFKLDRDELRSAKRGLLLLDRELERKLEKKLKNDVRFKKLRHELKVFYKDNINEVYRLCKIARALRRKMDEIDPELEEKKRTILA
ncbi:hypothetical protein KAU55_02790 [Candidatus Bathyarchaeota archaeon]|nr:hypothetical protein [Candidatus Bathyarchaeota archaeon]